mgnify:CR=1 FL=1
MNRFTNKFHTDLRHLNKGDSMKEIITRTEIKELQINEEIIERGMRSFIDVGQALSEIRNRRLWKGEYDSFNVYLRVRWGMGDSYASKLITGSEVASRLKDVTNENQARELSRVPFTDQEKVLHRAVEMAGNSNRTLTAGDIRLAASEPSVITARPDAEYGEVSECELWELAENTLKDFKQLVRRLSLHPEGCWLQGHMETLEVRVKNIDSILHGSKPAAPCPECSGGLIKNCEACRDRGWLPRDRYDAVLITKDVDKQ